MNEEEEELKKAVFLPVELYNRIEERARAMEFRSVEEYVTYVMEELLKEDDDEEEPALSEEEEEEVKKRLRALGYMT